MLPEMDMELIIKKSFHQFQHDKALPEARTACRCIVLSAVLRAPQAPGFD
jgi:hypothetical protein